MPACVIPDWKLAIAAAAYFDGNAKQLAVLEAQGLHVRDSQRNVLTSEGLLGLTLPAFARRCFPCLCTR